MRVLFTAFLAVFLLGAVSPFPAAAQAYMQVPALQVEPGPPPLPPGYRPDRWVLVPGHWHWNGRTYTNGPND